MKNSRHSLLVNVFLGDSTRYSKYVTCARQMMGCTVRHDDIPNAYLEVDKEKHLNTFLVTDEICGSSY